MKKKLFAILLAVSIFASACSSSLETQTPTAATLMPPTAAPTETALPTSVATPTLAPATPVANGFVARQKITEFYTSKNYVCSEPNAKNSLLCEIKSVNKDNGLSASSVTVVGNPVQKILVMVVPLEDNNSQKMVRASLMDLAAQIDETNATPVQEWINAKFTIPITTYEGEMSHNGVLYQMSISSNYIFLLVGRKNGHPSATLEPTHS
jgi:hypothetical protein